MTRPFVWLLLLLFALPTVSEPESDPASSATVPRVLIDVARAKGTDQATQSPSQATTHEEHAQDSVVESSTAAAVEGGAKESSIPGIDHATNYGRFEKSAKGRKPPATARPSKLPAAFPVAPTKADTALPKASYVPAKVPPTEPPASNPFDVFLENPKDTVKSAEATGKRADLSKCFKDKSTICFVGSLCNAANKKDHELSEVLDEYEEGDARRVAIEKCNVGVILTPLDGKYAFEYHTSQKASDFPFTLADRRIGFKTEGGIDRDHKLRPFRPHPIPLKNDFDCEPDCLITIYEGQTVKWGPQLYFAGHIELTGSKQYVKKVGVARSRGPSEADSMPYAIEPKPSERRVKASEVKADTEEESKKEESHLGKYLLIGGGVLVACIVLAFVVGFVIQRRQTTKSEQRRAAITAAATAAQSTAGSKPNSREASRRKAGEQQPLVQKTQKTVSTMTSVSVVAPTDMSE